MESERESQLRLEPGRQKPTAARNAPAPSLADRSATAEHNDGSSTAKSVSAEGQSADRR